MAALGLIFTAPLAFSHSFIRIDSLRTAPKGRGPLPPLWRACAFFGPFANNPGWGIFGSSLME